MTKQCEGCGHVAESLIDYRGHKLDSYCIVRWKEMEAKIGHEVEWGEYYRRGTFKGGLSKDEV